jgi:DNA-binding HxlR family transcriptional regulator
LTQNNNEGLLQTILSESQEEIAKLLRSAAHPARVKLLALLLNGEHEFSRLMQHTELSKTALANHLNQLITMRLVEKAARGEYSLTSDGKALLTAAAMVYKDSAQREKERLELLSRRYTEGLSEGRKLSKKVISKKVEYQPCWLSYTGAIAGSLKALGTDCDITDVGGYSGYAFLINVAKGVTCPSGPTALPADTWKQIHKATESLGWEMEFYGTPSSRYFAEGGTPTPKDMETAQKLFQKIKQEIDENNRPVVLWGLVVPEYGIVKGYEGDSYLTSTFRSITGQPETPILYYALKAPGCLEAFFFKNKIKHDQAKADKEALDRAINFASAKVSVLDNYVGGPAALDEWANVLEKAPKEKQNYMGNSYVGACVCEGRWMCAEFLKRLAGKYRGKQSKYLKEAAQSYEKGGMLLKEFTQLFPFKPQGEMKAEDCRKGAEILRKVKLSEEEAIAHMKKALVQWEKA